MPRFHTSGAVAVLIAGQAGAVARRQLTALGVRQDAIEAQVHADRWQSPQRGIYVAFTGTLPRETEIWVALLRAGPGATASHQTAAELDGFCDIVDPTVHVTVPAWRRVGGRMPGIRIHYAHRLPESRHPTRLPPRTRVEETVLDLVDDSPSPRAVAGWITAAVQRRRTSPSLLAAALASRKKISWRAVAESMILDVAVGAESPLELEFLGSVERAHALPTGSRQQRRVGARVIWIDVEYLAFATRVELDGRVGHEGEGRFRDRRRDNRGTVEGASTLRYGYAETYGTPCAVAAEIGHVLRARGWRGTPKPCNLACPTPVIMKEIEAHNPPKAS